MLAVVGLGLIGKDAICFDELAGHLTIHRHITQRRGVIIHLAIHGGPIEPLVVTRPQEEYPLVRLLRMELGVGGGRHIAREVIARVGYDQCCHTIIFLIIGMARQQTVNLVAQQLGITLVKSSRLCGWSHHWCCRLSITRIHHHDCR